RFALLGRDVSQLSNDQLRNLVAELERRFRDEALTSAAQAATIILDGVKADRWRILVGRDAHKIDEMVRQSPERAYDIAFFDEFARAAGWTERLSLLLIRNDDQRALDWRARVERGNAPLRRFDRGDAVAVSRAGNQVCSGLAAGGSRIRTCMGLFLSSSHFCSRFFVRSGKAVLRPVACDQVRGARGRGQGTETVAKLGGLPPSVACVSQRLDA